MRNIILRGAVIKNNYLNIETEGVFEFFKPHQECVANHATYYLLLYLELPTTIRQRFRFEVDRGEVKGRWESPLFLDGWGFDKNIIKADHFLAVSPTKTTRC